jgi:hypothetical protein
LLACEIGSEQHVLRKDYMSWEHKKYEAYCKNCGKKGFCIESQDDWGQSKTQWVGFETRAPDHYEVIRKRVGADELLPVCDCSKPKVVRGKRLGECDGTGEILEPAKSGNVLWVIVQFNTKHGDYSMKRQCVLRLVRRKKGVVLGSGIYVMSRTDASTPRTKVIKEFVEAGMLDEGDRVICVEAANWNTYPPNFRRRPLQPQFPTELEESG